MNHKCPNCGGGISIYWLLVKSIGSEYKCKKCHSILEKTSRFTIISGAIGGLSGAGGVVIMFTTMNRYGSYKIALTALFAYVIVLIFGFCFLVPGLVRIVPKNRSMGT